jgi:5-methylcytosine-specific restriction protein B
MNFTKDIIIEAIEKINTEPILRNNRSSSTYDLIYKDVKYPPILVLSVANQLKGEKELLLSDFNNNVDIPFKILRDHGFQVVEKNKEINIWIEKTITKKRFDRLEGERALGKALWSPQRGQKGADIYKNMTLVNRGDYILHLVDNSSISGISIVKNKAIETNGIKGTDWSGPAYLIPLENYTPFKTPLNRSDILKPSNKNILENISKTSEVFFNKKLDLRQGAYLTPCPVELLELINSEYFKINSENIPIIKLSHKQTTNKMLNFNYKSFHQKTKEAGLLFSEKIISRFIASLTAKPFLILSGLSGSGKTKIAQSFVQWICESQEQYKIVPVGADWTNREPLVGYPNGLVAEEYITPDSGLIHLLLEAVKSGNENKPFFLILDEMNLSHVERYFADFLSIMESKDTIKLYTGNTRESLDGLPIPLEIGWPKNVFIIGTVNIDETTYMFSPKVLDRANVIEFRITDDEIQSFLANPGIPDLTKLAKQGVAMAESFLSIASQNNIVKNEDIAKELSSFFSQLQLVGAEFGYRSATEIMQLAAKLKMLEPKITDNECLDIAIMQKLLPKLHGSRSKLVNVLIALGEICLIDAKDCKTLYFDAVKIDDFKKIPNIKYPISFEKLIRMYKNVLANGFTNYAEA